MNEIFERFAKNCPIPVALRATLERIFSPERVFAPEKLDDWFKLNADKQYTKELLFSTIFDLMSLVVFKVFPSVNAAYQSKTETIATSISSVYNKLNGLEPAVAAKLVNDTGRELASLVEGLKAPRNSLLPGYRVKMLNGNCIAKTEHCLEVLRHTNASPLPGKSLAIYDHALDMVADVFPCEDGHAQERSLLKAVLPTINANDVIVADRNFCVQDFLSGIGLASGYFVIRLHELLPIEPLDMIRSVGETDTGEVLEQNVKIRDSKGEHECVVRLITLRLKKATRDEDKRMQIVTNLPEDVSTCTIADIYRDRWSIETLFQKLVKHLKSEMNTLGYPKAALFGFCIALVSYNILSVVKAAMRSVHGEEKIENEVSGYYLAGEMARTKEGMEVALPSEEWEVFRKMPEGKFIAFLKRLMENVVLSKYKKHKRGHKKPLPKRDQHSNTPHVSTYKLLNEKKKNE